MVRLMRSMPLGLNGFGCDRSRVQPTDALGFERRNGVIEYGGLPVNDGIATSPTYLMNVEAPMEFGES
jgi:hypothetical protein